MRESLPGVSTRLSACPSSTVQVTTSTSARGRGPLPVPAGFGPVFEGFTGVEYGLGVIFKGPFVGVLVFAQDF